MKPFEILVKDDFFTEEELDLIWHELHVLCQPEVTHGPERTGAARDDGEVIKKNKGIFLQDFYRDLNGSPLFRASRKIFEGLTEDFADLCFANKFVLSTSKSTYLMSYYGDGDSYLCHKDSAITTVLYWFCKEARASTGGDLYLNEIDETVEFKHNRMVMFPSWAEHEVSEVTMTEPDTGAMGRFCVTQFLML